MAKAFRPVDRDQQFLLPPDMGQWLPSGHLAWFVISVVEQLDLDAFEREHRLGGVGRAAFDPRMLLGLLVYAYAVGQRSSRQIERLCSSDVAFRVICAQDTPDHTTIARFRQRHRRGVAEVFTQVLGLCAKAGLGRVGVVAIDGTKIAANAAGSANRSAGWLREQATRIVAEAGEVDAAEDALFGAARGDELPEEFTDPRTRAARIKAALVELDEQNRAAARAERASTARSWGRWEQRRVQAEADLAAAHAQAEGREQSYRQAREDAAAGRGKPPDGRPPVPPAEHVRVRQAGDRVRRITARRDRAGAPGPPDPGATMVNLSDPDSRIMHTQKGWVQGYNAQLAVSDDQIILAAVLTQQGNDINQFVPMMTKAAEAAALMNAARGEPEHIQVVLADAGYLSRANLAAPGPDRLIAVGKRRDQDRAARTEPATGAPAHDADPIEAMAHRLRTAQDLATYRRRGVTVEPVNGHLKDRIGLRQFARRGLQAANSELQLAATVANLLKVYRATPAIPTAG
jgi:transposase